MGKFKSQQEVDQKLDEFIEDLADLNSKNETWKDIVGSIFSSGITYKDPTTGEIKVSEKVNVQELKSQDNEVHKLYQNLFSGSEELISEVVRSTNTSTLMGWYCRTKGISTEELFELGTHPDSEKSLATKEKLESIKQGFCDLINSNDMDKISDFYVQVYAAFQEDFPTMLTATDTEKLKEAYPHYSVWTASESFITQSLENSKSYKETTEKQHQHCTLIEEKLKKKFGPDVNLGTMAGQMGSANVLMQLANNKDLTSKENLLKAEAKLSGNDLKLHKTNLRSKVSQAVSSVKAQADWYQRSIDLGKPLPTTSNELASAIGLMQGGFTDFLDQDIFGKEVSSDGSYYQSQSASILGDNTFYTIYDASTVGSYPIVKVSPYAHINCTPLVDDVMPEVIHMDELKTCRDQLYAPGKKHYCEFLDNFSEKMEKNEPLSYAELFTFTSFDCEEYSPTRREKVSQFLSVDGTGRLSSLDKTSRYLVENMTRFQYNMSAAEYANGGLVERQVASGYQILYDQIEKGVTTQSASSLVHKTQMDNFKQAMKKTGSVEGSSAEYKELHKAFVALDSKEPNYPQGHEAEYQKKLENLAKAADTYIKAKEKDGKKERFTDRGQVRYQMAKRMLAFANTSIKSIEKINELSAKPSIIARKPTPEIAMKNADMMRRIDTLMGRINGDCQDLIDANVYQKGDLNISAIDYPKDVPFSDHEIALIGVASLTDRFAVEGTRYDYKNMSDQEAGRCAYTHTTQDIFMELRSGHGDLLGKFENARQIAHDNIIAYMNGDKEPLAKMLGNNLKAILESNQTVSNYSNLSHDRSTLSQEMMQLFQKDPELATLSGLSAKEMQAIKGYEMAAKVYEDSTVARAKLIMDMKDPKLTDAQKQDLLAEAFTINIYSNQNNDLFAKNSAQLEDSQYQMNMAQKFTAQSIATNNLTQAKVNGASQEELQKLEKASMEAEVALSEFLAKHSMDIADKGYSAIITNAGKNPTAYQEGKQVLMNSIKQTQAFKDLYASGDWKDLITSDEKMMRMGTIHKEINKQLSSLKQAAPEKSVQKAASKKAEKKETKKEVKSASKGKEAVL